MIEGDRAMYADLACNILHAARFTVGVEAEQDVSTCEVTQRAEGAFHVRCSHFPQDRTRLVGLSAEETALLTAYSGRHQAVAMLWPAGTAVAHGQLDATELAEMVEVPARGNATHACLLRDGGRRQA